MCTSSLYAGFAILALNSGVSSSSKKYSEWGYLQQQQQDRKTRMCEGRLAGTHTEESLCCAEQ